MKNVGKYLVLSQLANNELCAVYQGLGPKSRKRVVIKLSKGATASINLDTSKDDCPCGAGRINDEEGLQFLESGTTDEGMPFMVLQAKKKVDWNGLLCDACYPMVTAEQVQQLVVERDAVPQMKPDDSAAPEAAAQEPPPKAAEKPAAQPQPAAEKKPERMVTETVFGMAIPESVTDTHAHRVMKNLKLEPSHEDQVAQKGRSSSRRGSRLLISLLAGAAIGLTVVFFLR